MIKRLWQFPAVIGGTALLTFCGVSALQASINAPLHAFGVAVEAARASASASLSPTLVAAPPIQRPGSSDAQATPGSPQVQAAAAAPTSPVPQAAPAAAPAPKRAPVAAPVQDDQGSQPEGSQPPASQSGDQGVAQGNDQGDQGQQGQQGNGNGWGAGGQTVRLPRGSGSNAGSGQAFGQQGRVSSQTSAAGSQGGISQGRLSSELNQWLGLLGPGQASKAGQSAASTGKSSTSQQNSQGNN